MSSTFMSCIIWNNGTESELGIRCNIGSIHFFCFCWSLENVLAHEGRAQTECFAISGYSRNAPLWKSLIISSWRVPLPVLEAEVIHLFSQLLNFIDVQSHTFQRLYFKQPSFRHFHLETRSRKVLMYMGHRMTSLPSPELQGSQREESRPMEWTDRRCSCILLALCGFAVVWGRVLLCSPGWNPLFRPGWHRSHGFFPLYLEHTTPLPPFFMMKSPH